MADVEMSDAPSAGKKGDVSEGKKKFEVKKVGHAPLNSLRLENIVLTAGSGMPLPFGPGIS